jgi:hypothetical protein
LACCLLPLDSKNICCQEGMGNGWYNNVFILLVWDAHVMESRRLHWPA